MKKKEQAPVCTCGTKMEITIIDKNNVIGSCPKCNRGVFIRTTVPVG